ncbi:MAG: hypothetical protein AAF721_18935 [Myxococcota bacterium]
MGRPIRDKLVHELHQLGEQKRRYLMAIEVADESAMLRRRIRSVRRLEDEIAARKEVLRGLSTGTVLSPGYPPAFAVGFG